MKKFKIYKKLIDEKVYFRIKEKCWIKPKYFLWWKTKEGYWDWFVITKKVSTGYWDEYTSGVINVPINFKTKKEAEKYIKNLKYK